jgi:hypothetical protein
MNSCASVNLMPSILICSLLQWQLYVCNMKQSSGPTWVLLWRHSLLSSIKDLHPLLQSQHRRHPWVEVLYVMYRHTPAHNLAIIIFDMCSWEYFGCLVVGVLIGKRTFPSAWDLYPAVGSNWFVSFLAHLGLQGDLNLSSAAWWA